ncbi:hypothetical protein DERF_016046 [Dermatophagoides farinae]|uniref:Uncharacterized protein n=1 Tax=Dermatophagoides farinae TaxID=6954 RepID=A0A922KW32_DERFA|nr:hypothetical protein DERF_016046 [Dermatophagoides farinae]
MDSRFFSRNLPSLCSSAKSSSTHPLSLSSESPSKDELNQIKSLNIQHSIHHHHQNHYYSINFASRLILFQTFLGTTYRGSYFHYFSHSKFNHKCLKWLSCLYEMITFIGILLFMRNTFDNSIFQSMFNYTNKTYTMIFVFKLTGFCLLLEQIVMKFMTLFHGYSIVGVVYKIAKNSHWKKRYDCRFMYLYASFQLSINIIGFLLITNYVGYSIYMKIAYVAGAIIFGTSKLSVATIHSFVSVLINHRIQDWKNRFHQYQNYSKLLREIIEQRNHLKELNQRLSLIMFVKVIVNSIELASLICFIEDMYSTGQDSVIIMAIFCFLLSTWFELFINFNFNVMGFIVLCNVTLLTILGNVLIQVFEPTNPINVIGYNNNLMMMAKIYHCESHSKRLISSKIDKQLYRIILFQTIFDCTYMGEYFRRKNDGKKFQKYFTTLFAIIQETIYGIPAALLWYLSATSYSADYLFEETAVHNTMRYLFSLFHFCILIETLSVKLTNIFRGHRIIAIIQDIGNVGLANLNHIHYQQYYQSDKQRRQSIISNENNMMTRFRPLISNGEYHCLEQICTMHNSFYFIVMEMFDLKHSTMLSLVSYVMSNAILLIQTKD